jgi:MFS transporter, putative metabolite:H+ symporter
MNPKKGLAWSVAVSALGYFVDLYDIVIFGVVRVTSLGALGLVGQQVTDWGVHLLNLQMLGMLAGGVCWGVVGDRFGRRFTLLATISLYSLANIANAAVGTVGQYAVLRFVAGFGLAGELGAGVTLVSELLPAAKRGYGTTVISFLGLVGALTASYIGSGFGWRTAYLAGGGLGLLVLIGRLWGLRESDLYTSRRAGAGHQGDLWLILGKPKILQRFLAVVAAGVPIWYVSALFVNLAPEIGKGLGLAEPLKVGAVLGWQAAGLAIGSACSGFAGEWLHSRKRVIWFCLVAMAVLVLVLLHLGDARAYGEAMFIMGLFQGYWTVYLTMGAEQFGTNIRATVSTSVPNFVRAMTVPVTSALLGLEAALGVVHSVLLIGAVVFALAALGLWSLRETFGKDLDFSES